MADELVQMRLDLSSGRSLEGYLATHQLMASLLPADARPELRLNACGGASIAWRQPIALPADPVHPAFAAPRG